eukprot:CAMPEP_0118885434 /NCGR_PEP_ID=MMETSP1163-20130328/23913_1 /TAXON_ID=124430 /ORGANISM="Phaeomonas parva, Strain CCMP2877" /LENGTH=208 /DNA_ID=CAMNT_0006823451 /DNA_START=10 /DNA_END=636 /DNA_ORIENTATION=+
MFRTFAALALVASASAFAPKAVPRAGRQAMRMSFESEIGAQPPLGFWDPLNLLKDADQERFDRLRTVEVKHGRISMLAILGHLVTTAGVRLPGQIAYTGELKFADIPTGLAAFSKIPVWGAVQLFGFIGLCEFGFAQVKDDIEADCEARMDGNGWDAATKDSKRGIELNNGRAAMMGILGLMVHEKLDNNPYIINDLIGSPIDFNAGF